MREVAIIGTGINKWGELWEKSIRDIFVEVALKAIDNSKASKIDALYIGSMSSGLFVGQEHLASLLTDYLGFGGIPATRVESACASGSLAFKSAFLDVACGYSDVVLVGGVEKMTDVSGDEATYVLSTASDQEWESYNGVTFPGLYALMARAYLEEHKVPRRYLSEVAVKNHEHGSRNPNAQFPFKITAEDVETSPMVADPLRVYDCSPVTDGAAALVISSLETAKKLGIKPIVKVKGIGHATDTIALHSRKNLTVLNSTTLAAQQAYKMAGIGPSDIDFVEVHDCFTIAELIVLESLGLFEKGLSGKATAHGETRIEGKLPVNPSGGLKSKGHPVGATGIAQLVEITEQLRQNCGSRQVKRARRGLAQNMGGTGGSSIVSILEVE